MATISPAFVTIFDNEVKQAYQASRALAGLVREKSVEGDTVKFNKLGKGVASVRTPQADVSPMNLTYSLATATMTDYIAAEYSDIFDQSHVGFNDRQELVQAVGNAIGRRMDQVVIDALDAATPVSVANTIANNVPANDRVCLIHANNLSALIGNTEVQSSDFSNVKALVDGSINQFLGMRIVVIGDRDEGGLTKDGSNDRSCYAFHKSALGLGMSMGQKSEVNYIPEKVSYLVASMFGAGAVAIDDGTAGGIVKITCREA
jgi:hypothetical protein